MISLSLFSAVGRLDKPRHFATFWGVAPGDYAGDAGGEGRMYQALKGEGIRRYGHWG